MSEVPLYLPMRTPQAFFLVRAVGEEVGGGAVGEEGRQEERSFSD